jgi:tetratricopeptide (TPR) repeat protein
LTVYRGQFLHTEDIDKLQQSVGQLISTNGFLSTTRSLTVAEMFAGPGDFIFEYVIDTRLNQNIIFADISEHSEMPHEEEVLFDVGTTFRVEKVYFDKSSGFWKVNLIAVDEKENLTNDFIRQRHNHMITPSIVQEFGFLLIEMGQYSKAISYFDNLIQQHQNDDIFKLTCYYSLAFSYLGNYQYVKAIQYATFAYKKCIELSSNTGKGDRMLSRLFDLLGSIHLKREETELALKYYHQSININPSDADNPEILALYHRTEANMCLSQGNYSQALDHFQETLTIYENWMPFDDRALAESHHNLGRTYLAIKDYEQAFGHLQITLELYKKILPTHHSAFSDTYQQLANIYHHTKKYDLALEYYLKAEKSALTFKKFTDNSDLRSAELCSLTGNCYLHKNENAIAEQYFKTSLALYEKCRSSVKRENVLIDIQWNMAVVFSRKREFYSALEHYKESLMLVERIMPDERIRIAELNDGIGACYENTGQYDLCIEHTQKSLEIYEQCIPPDVEKLADMHNTVSRCYCMKHEYLLAIKHRKQSLSLEEQNVPRNLAQIAGLHTSIGWSYHLNGDYDLAIDYCMKSIHIFEKHKLIDHQEYGNVLSTLGVIYFKINDFDRAFMYCSMSMEIFSKNKNMESDHPAIADNYEILGNLCIMNKKQTSAFNFYILALHLLKRILPPEHEYITRVRTSLYQITEVEF